MSSRRLRTASVEDEDLREMEEEAEKLAAAALEQEAKEAREAQCEESDVNMLVQRAMPLAADPHGAEGPSSSETTTTLISPQHPAATTSNSVLQSALLQEASSKGQL